MSIKYKFDVMKALKDAGYVTKVLRTEYKLPEGTMTRLRNGQDVSFSSLSIICKLLKCQPGDIIEYVPDDEQ